MVRVLLRPTLLAGTEKLGSSDVMSCPSLCQRVNNPSAVEQFSETLVPSTGSTFVGADKNCPVEKSMQS